MPRRRSVRFTSPSVPSPDVPPPGESPATAGRGRPGPRRAREPARDKAFRTLVEATDGGMMLADERGIVLHANAASEHYLGLSPAELAGRLGFDLVRPEHLPLARDAFAHCLGNPNLPVPVTVDVQHRSGDSRTQAVQLVNKLTDPGVKAVLVYFRDAASHGDPGQRELEGYRALFDHAPIGLGVADLEGNLLAFNDAMLVPGGYSRDDILKIGNVSLLYAAPEDRERVLAVARDRGCVSREEVRFRRKDGSSYVALLSLTPAKFRGRACWYATVEDVTQQRQVEQERHRLETQLRQAQKMEAVGRMTGGIAHDFNNILSVMMANADLVASALDPTTAAAARGDLAELRKAAERGAAMIRKLLGFSRHADLSLVPTDLGDLVHRLQGMLRHLVPEHIELETTGDPGCVALCDPGAVEQIVLNLATNARDAMPAGGTVTISWTTTVVGRDTPGRPAWMEPGEFVRLSVSDTGMGMDETTRSRALEPFFSTKAPGIGTGLGLSMAYGLVKQQRGFIEISSEPGAGTTVHIHLPRTVAEARRRRLTPSDSAVKRGSATILLLEDDESLRRTGRRVLEHLGYRVLVASDGREGLALFQTHQDEIDLVISDMVMPGLTGAQVYDVVRQRRPVVPFLLSSGYQERPDQTLEVPRGVRVVPKPWTIEQLAETIREALDATR